MGDRTCAETLIRPSADKVHATGHIAEAPRAETSATRGRGTRERQPVNDTRTPRMTDDLWETRDVTGTTHDASGRGGLTSAGRRETPAARNGK